MQLAIFANNLRCFSFENRHFDKKIKNFFCKNYNFLFLVYRCIDK